MMNSLHKQIYLVFFVLAVNISGCIALTNSGTKTDDENEMDKVEVTAECAVVLVTAGLIAGGTVTVATSVLFSWVLGAIGFTAVGIEGGSYAGSLFAKLQSIAMSGVTTTVMPYSLVGGAVGATAAHTLHEVCQVIDGIKPDGNAGKAISVLLDALKQFKEAKNGGSSLGKYVKRGYNAAADGLEHLKDASWHYIHEMMPNNDHGGKFEVAA
mmetsp:Transcript_33391/g.56782  ORF Transcript_33391/g.56782 Transcript_33391/m.56782 type:complete len:212 (+) Transcript_33391:147-782(+)